MDGPAVLVKVALLSELPTTLITPVVPLPCVDRVVAVQAAAVGKLLSTLLTLEFLHPCVYYSVLVKAALL